MEKEIKITLEDLERMLNRQKEIVIEKLSDHTSYWNGDSTESHYRSVNINKEKFSKQGMTSRFPEDFNVLKKYIR
jgi:hypothetical protein